MVVGGSWGATLALAYAQAHPERVTGIVLRATFLGTRAELEGAFLNALPRFYPELYEDFLGVLPEEERAQPLEAYWRRILDPDPAVHGPPRAPGARPSGFFPRHRPSRDRLDFGCAAIPRAPLPATPFMEAHYFQNDCFMAPDQLMNEAGRLADIPGIIVQGRYDLLCPPATSHALAARWPRCGSSPRRRRRPFAVRSRRPRCRDEGDRGYGVENHRIRTAQKCRWPEKACC